MTESTPEEIFDGGFGGLVVEPDITGSGGRPPTPPSEKYGGVERDRYLVGCTKRSSNGGLNTYIGG
ncbi:MAG: hypothetical protein GX808_12665 [Syntrophomonadaceae bacterium]|nr:hypothetical protein [Syntrophomonadaceae bacterium]